MRRLVTILAAVTLAAPAAAVLADGPAAAAVPAPVPCVGCYVPAPVTSWQIQLQGKVNQKVPAQLYDVDLFDTPVATIAQLHAQGRKVACYFSAGSFEDWRVDAGAFPAVVKGASNGWPGERWLDVRRMDVLAPILEARLDLCKAKGFDTADADNVDGYTNATGFPLTAADQLAFNVWLANAAHARGLSIALKNDMSQGAELVAYFDWTVNEQCHQYQECDTLLPFANAGKAVMQIEYRVPPKKFCPAANARNFNAIKKGLALRAARVACR
jgi:hypothetical protein